MTIYSFKSALFLFVLCLLLTVQSFAQVQGWGQNLYGSLGNGGTNISQTLPSAAGLPQTTGISGGIYHTLLLQADGTVLATGQNNNGQLGSNSIGNQSTPVLVSGISTAVQVGGGGNHSLALLADGTVRAWGNNNYGQIGDGSTNQQGAPVAVSNLTNVIAVDGGLFHSLALKADGTVWAWGRNNYGQLGDNTLTNRAEAVQVQGLTNVIAVGGGENHSLALRADGTVWVWGNNTEAEAGNNTQGGNNLVPVQATISGVSQIAAGKNFNLVLKRDGTVWVWGSNSNVQIGTGTQVSYQRVPLQNTAVANVIDIRAKGYTCYVRLRDGSVYSWGFNYNGQLGIGTTTESFPYGLSTPVQVPVGSGNAIIGSGQYHAFVANPQITTGTGTNQALQGDNLKINFANVTAAGTTSYTALDPTSTAVTSLTLPVGYTIQNNQPAYNVTTTASLTGNIQICVQLNGEYDPSVLSQLKLMHGEGSALVNRTTSIDLRKRQICATTTSLSPFVVALGPGATAAEASISGRVLTTGKGLANAKVELTGTGGVTKTVLTNAFGNFTINEVEAGATYIVNISAKKYTFAPQIVSVTDNVSGLTFTAQ